MNNLEKFKHFIQRTKERFGLDLTLQDLQFIAESIKSCKAKLVKAESRGFHYKVRFKNDFIFVVLNRGQSYFVTALTMTKGKNKTHFNGKQFNYEDTLYINWQFNKCFKHRKGKNYCPRCGSPNIEVDLGKDRFKCCNCYLITKFKEPRLPEIYLLSPDKDKKFSLAIRLSTDLWWYLYKNKKDLCIEGIKINAKLIDNDKREYYIQYKDVEKVVSHGIYSVLELKEVLNDTTK
jgi:hypothetical protein